MTVDGRYLTIISKLAEGDPHLVGIDLSRNFGHQRALTAGLSMARGEAIFVIDADLQDPLNYLVKCCGCLDAGADGLTASALAGRRKAASSAGAPPPFTGC